MRSSRPLLRRGKQTEHYATGIRVNGNIIGNCTLRRSCAGLVFALEGKGSSNYFGYGSRSKAYRSIDQYVFERVRRFLARRHKVPKTGAEEGQAARRAPA